jgi:endonuclease/exonuclease/phosphatase family metal-dependent hydrolase
MVFCSALLLSLGPATLRPARAARPLTVATWNLEWLVTAETAHAGRLACRAGRRTALPCDVALEQSRDSADLARLARHARRVAADVFAFQEVENSAIARRVFRNYDICIAPGKGLQHVGFAIRRSLPHRCGGTVDSLSLNGAQRPGLLLTLLPDSAAPIDLMVVHLKSGCADAVLPSQSAACAILTRQAEALHQWFVEHAALRPRFIVLGDFNRSDREPQRDLFWRTLRGEASHAPFTSAGAAVPYRNCYVGAPFSRAIDHVLVSRALENALLAGGYRRFGYDALEATRYRLSDHCPVRVSLILPSTLPEPIEGSAISSEPVGGASNEGIM